MKTLKIAITSGYAASKHAIALLHEINGLPEVEVVLLLQVKTFSIKRLKQLVRMYGMSNAWRRFKNTFFTSGDNRFANEVLYINRYLKERKISHPTVSTACHKLHVKFKRVKSLNDEECIRTLKADEIDLIVYAGGGIVRGDFIKSSRYGVLNAHAGPLPYFRGMNCVEWTLLYGVKPEITVHLIEEGIDTGPILMRYPFSVDSSDSISTLRGKCTVFGVTAILKVLKGFDNYYANRQLQSLAEGRQFFAMHHFLRDRIDERLQAGWRPERSFEDFLKKQPKS